MTPIPGFAVQPGLVPAIEAAGVVVSCVGGVWCASDVPTAQAVMAGYAPLAWLKSNYLKTGALDQLQAAASSAITLFNLIDGGTVTTLTGAQVAAFLAAVANNYRTLRAAIEAAPDATTLAAINIGTGWPANP